jgi:predicted amidohydrolase YtcJ
VTSFHDASAGNTLEDFSLFQQLTADGLLTSRATVMIGIDAFPQLLDTQLAPFSGNDQVRLGSIKIMLHESQGSVHPEPEVLREMVWQAHQHGFQLAFHAVEEAAISMALDALEHAQQRFPRSDHRHRIEHCFLCPPPFIKQIAKTACAVVSQPGFLHWYGEKYAAEIDADIHDWLHRSKSLIDQGIHVAGSSDCPIAPLGPLTSIQTAVTRQSQIGRSLNRQEGVTLAEALPLFTSTGAWVGFEEDKKGKIVPGMLADLVVLDGDITAVPVQAISSLSVVTTIVGGKVAWNNT